MSVVTLTETGETRLFFEGGVTGRSNTPRPWEWRAKWSVVCRRWGHQSDLYYRQVLYNPAGPRWCAAGTVPAG